MTIVVPVDLGQDAYNIHIGSAILSQAGIYLAQVLKSKRVCVVTDENVAKSFLLPLMQNLEGAGFIACPPIILAAGEGTKSFSKFEALVEKLLSYRVDRGTTVLALGGGVIGDITGFAAAVVLRGIPFVQIPTTLLAQVDSSVGGKTGINTRHGKNLIGAFHQPRLVLIDTDTLSTLPLRERQAGYAEILKYALIDRPDFFNWLEAQGTAVLAGDKAAIAHAIATSCRAKAGIVVADEKERKGVRDLLNLGHTFGHALEAIGGYDGRLLHGEAVAIGLKMAFDFSVRLGLCPPQDAARVTAHLTSLKLMTAPPFAVGPTEMLEAMRSDKKARDGHLTLILARGIGQSFLAPDVSDAALRTYLQEAME